MAFREFILKSGEGIFLGKDADSNDELVKKFKGKENIILHTIAPGSPFCVIDSENPSKEDVQEAAIICAAKSQDWRDNQKDVKLHQFTGKDVKKPFFAKAGTWRVNKSKTIKVKKKDIIKLIEKIKK